MEFKLLHILFFRFSLWEVECCSTHKSLFFSLFFENGKWGCFRSGFSPPLSKRCQSPSSGNGSLFFNEKEVCSVERRCFFCYRLCYTYRRKEEFMTRYKHTHFHYIFLLRAFLVYFKKHSFLRFGIRRKLFRPHPPAPHVKLWWGGFDVCVFPSQSNDVIRTGNWSNPFSFLLRLMAGNYHLWHIPKRKRKEGGRRKTMGYINALFRI